MRSFRGLRGLTVLVALGALCVAPSCASSRSDGADRPTRPQRRSSTLITSDELAASAAPDLYAAVQRLRPDWLVNRGAMSPSAGVPQLIVYMDGQRLGNRNILSSIPITAIKEVRYYSAPDATQRWGTGHAGGVIEVVSR